MIRKRIVKEGYTSNRKTEEVYRKVPRFIKNKTTSVK